MGKVKKIFLSLLLSLSIFTLCGCGTKKSITADSYKTFMLKNGYEVVDSTSQYQSSFSLKKSFIAAKKDRTYQIEFIEFNTIEEAVKIYNINKQLMEEKKDNVVTGYINIDGKNYSKYKAISGGKYRAITRINNTLMYVDINQEYSKEAAKIVSRLGY